MLEVTYRGTENMCVFDVVVTLKSRNQLNQNLPSPVAKFAAVLHVLVTSSHTHRPPERTPDALHQFDLVSILGS